MLSLVASDASPQSRRLKREWRLRSANKSPAWTTRIAEVPTFCAWRDPGLRGPLGRCRQCGAGGCGHHIDRLPARAAIVVIDAVSLVVALD